MRVTAMQRIAETEAEMLALGREIGALANAGDIICIDGPLGAGKTVLSRGILEGLGYLGDVQSPTYAIVHAYEPPDTRFPVLHADIYRLQSDSELEETGLLDQPEDVLIIVEWGARFAETSDLASMQIDIEPSASGTRVVTLSKSRSPNA